MKSCFMFGHRTAPYSILPQIEQAIENHYTKYVKTKAEGKDGGLWISGSK